MSELGKILVAGGIIGDCSVYRAVKGKDYRMGLVFLSPMYEAFMSLLAKERRYKHFPRMSRFYSCSSGERC